MDQPLQLGMYATDNGDSVVVHVTLRTPCDEHGTDYLVREIHMETLSEAPDVWLWGQALLAHLVEEHLCCADGWAQGTALPALPQDAR